MDAKKLSKLLKKQEDVKLEFKRQMYELYSDPETKKRKRKNNWNEFLKDIIALANGNIGTSNEDAYLIVGASDKLNGDGSRDLYDIDSLNISRRQLLDILGEVCHPPFEDIHCDSVEFEGRILFIITIPPSNNLYFLDKDLQTSTKKFSEGTVLLRRKDGEKIYIADDQAKYRIGKEKRNRQSPKKSDNYRKLTSPSFIEEQIREGRFSEILSAYSITLNNSNNSTLFNPLDELDTLRLIQSTLRFSESTLKKDVNQLANQLIGRLLFSKEFEIQEFLASVREWQEDVGSIWLEPISSSLKHPISSLLNIFKGHNKIVSSIAIEISSEKMISGSIDGSLKAWSIDEGKNLSSWAEAHANEVILIAIAPDKKSFISAASDFSLKIWKIGNEKSVFNFGLHGDIINSISVTPDSKKVISASDDCKIRVWSLNDGSLIKDKTFDDPVMNTSITRDGRYLLFSSDRFIYVWDFESEDIRKIAAHDSRINILYLFLDEQYIVSASDDETIKIWNFNFEACKTKHGYRVSNLDVTPDGKSIIFTDDDDGLLIWSWQSPNSEPSKINQKLINDFSIAANGKFLIIALPDRIIQVWDIANQKMLDEISSENDEPLSLAVLPDDRRFIFTLDNKNLQLWGLTIYINEAHPDKVSRIDVTPDGAKVISISENLVKVWRSDNAQFLKNIELSNGLPNYALTNDEFIFASDDGILHIYNLENNEEQKIALFSRAISKLITIPDLKYIICTSEDEENPGIFVYKMGNETPYKKLTGHEKPIIEITTDLEKNIMVSFSSEKSIIWKLDTFDLLYIFIGESEITKFPIRHIEMFPKRDYLLSGLEDFNLRILNLHNGKLLFTIPERKDSITTIAISPNLEKVIVGIDGRVEIWSVLDKVKLIYVIDAHSAPVNSIIVTPCSRYIISTSDDFTIKVWRILYLEDGEILRDEKINNSLVATFTGESEMISCSINQDGSIIFSGEKSGRVHFLKLNGV